MKKLSLLSVLQVLVLLFFFQQCYAQSWHSQWTGVFLLELFANGSQYDGRPIRVRGYTCVVRDDFYLVARMSDCNKENQFVSIGIASDSSANLSGFRSGQVGTFWGKYTYFGDKVVLDSPFYLGMINVEVFMLDQENPVQVE